MDIQKITNQLNGDNLDRINHNFSELSKIEYRVIQDMISSDPAKLTPGINGMEKPPEIDLRNFNDYGVNFRVDTNGIIHKVSIYANREGQLGVGLAKQNGGSIAGAELYYKIIQLKSGWNEVELNFPIEQNARYTLFRRTVSDSVATAGITVSGGWNNYPFMTNGIGHFFGGMYLNQTGTSRHYTTFFEIQVITSLAQIYKIANDSVKPSQQFYVGDNPPQDAQFWFKPVSGGGN